MTITSTRERHARREAAASRALRVRTSPTTLADARVVASLVEVRGRHLPGVRLRAVALLVVIVTAAFAGCGQRSGTPSDAVPHDDSPAAPSWRALEPRIRAVPSDAPTGQVRWTAPAADCVLRYAVDAESRRALEADADPSSPSGAYYEGLLELRRTAPAQTFEIAPTSEHTGLLHADARSAPAGSDPTHAPPRLHIDRAGLQEVDGTTLLWSALGSFGGLVQLFPRLPDEAKPGATVDWSFAFHDGNAAVGTEARRGHVRASPDALRSAAAAGRASGVQHVTVRVRLVRWVRVGARRAAVLDGSSGFDGPMPWTGPAATTGAFADVRAKSKTHYHWVVTEDGRLLHAAVLNHTRMTMSGQAHSLDSRLEARLVSACDGPTLPTFERAIPASELALATYAELLGAAGDGATARVEAILAPTLTDPSIAPLLVRVARRYGPGVLGISALAEIESSPGGHVTIRSPATFEDGSTLPSGQASLRFAVVGGRALVEGIDVSIPAADQDDGTVAPEEHVLAVDSTGASSSVANWEPLPSDPQSALTVRQSVDAAAGQIVLVRRGVAMCALRATAPATGVGGRASFEWWSWRSSETPREAGHASAALLEDDEPVVHCGDIDLGWSAPAYVYFGSAPGASAAVELAPTQFRTIAEVDTTSPAVRWFHRRWGQAAYDARLDTLR